MDDKNVRTLKEARLEGDELHIDLWYPDTDDAAVRCFVIGLVDVRSADGIRISYDKDRDGWSIEQALNHDWPVDDDVRDLGWYEVSFVPAWNRADGKDGYTGRHVHGMDLLAAVARSVGYTVEYVAAPHLDKGGMIYELRTLCGRTFRSAENTGLGASIPSIIAEIIESRATEMIEEIKRSSIDQGRIFWGKHDDLPLAADELAECLAARGIISMDDFTRSDTMKKHLQDVLDELLPELPSESLRKQQSPRGDD